MSNQNYYSWKHKAADFPVFNKMPLIHIDLFGTSDSFLKSLQKNVLLLKILILHFRHTMRKLRESDCLSKKGRVRVKREGEQIKSSY
jgi:hypothetical protein